MGMVDRCGGGGEVGWRLNHRGMRWVLKSIRRGVGVRLVTPKTKIAKIIWEGKDGGDKSMPLAFSLTVFKSREGGGIR